MTDKQKLKLLDQLSNIICEIKDTPINVHWTMSNNELLYSIPKRLDFKHFHGAMCFYNDIVKIINDILLIKNKIFKERLLMVLIDLGYIDNFIISNYLKECVQPYKIELFNRLKNRYIYDFPIMNKLDDLHDYPTEILLRYNKIKTIGITKDRMIQAMLNENIVFLTYVYVKHNEIFKFHSDNLSGFRVNFIKNYEYEEFKTTFEHYNISKFDFLDFKKHFIKDTDDCEMEEIFNNFDFLKYEKYLESNDFNSCRKVIDEFIKDNKIKLFRTRIASTTIKYLKNKSCLLYCKFLINRHILKEEDLYIIRNEKDSLCYDSILNDFMNELTLYFMKNNEINSNYFVYKIYAGIELLYIGKTSDLNSRITSHLKGVGSIPKNELKKVTQVKYSQFISENEASIYEIYLISTLNPILNKEFGNDKKLSIILQDKNFIDYLEYLDRKSDLVKILKSNHRKI